MRRIVTCGLLALTALTMGSAAQAQKVDRPWSVDFGTGWDRSISGNINSSAIGTLNGLSVVILPNKYEDVYGTGLYLRFGGGYLIDDRSQLRVSFTFQSLDADLTRMGDLGASNLYGQYADYQSFGIDFGYRRYFPFKRAVRGYAEGSLGVSIIDETDVVLAAPAINFTTTATDFYDKTAAFSLGGNAGVAFGVTPRVDLFAQLGLRFVTGMSEVDNLIGTGLDTINDHSARWSLPFAFGVNYRF